MKLVWKYLRFGDSIKWMLLCPEHSSRQHRRRRTTCVGTITWGQSFRHLWSVMSPIKMTIYRVLHMFRWGSEGGSSLRWCGLSWGWMLSSVAWLGRMADRIEGHDSVAHVELTRPSSKVSGGIWSRRRRRRLFTRYTLIQSIAGRRREKFAKHSHRNRIWVLGTPPRLTSLQAYHWFVNNVRCLEADMVKRMGVNSAIKRWLRIRERLNRHQWHVKWWQTGSTGHMHAVKAVCVLERKLWICNRKLQDYRW